MKKICCVLLLACMLAGCCRVSAPPTVRVVERITVSNASSRDTPIRVYSDSRKMKRVLDYLRLLERRTADPREAELGDGITFLITLHHSDGSISVYRQKAWRYLHSHGGWEKISPRQARQLPLLLAAIPGD